MVLNLILFYCRINVITKYFQKKTPEKNIASDKVTFVDKNNVLCSACFINESRFPEILMIELNLRAATTFVLCVFTIILCSLYRCSTGALSISS